MRTPQEFPRAGGLPCPTSDGRATCDGLLLGENSADTWAVEAGAQTRPALAPPTAAPRGVEGKIALAVATRDRPELLARFLLPGLKEAARAGYEVVVVDQSVGDRTSELVEGIEGVLYRRSEAGLSRGRNAAVAATTASLIAFTDDDVSIPPGWLETIVRLFGRSPDIGAVCGRANSTDGKLQPGSRSGVYRWPSHPFRLGSGFNLALRRESLEDVGLFDESLGAGAPYASAEDTDMLYRLLGAGWAVVCSDEITVVHHDWRSQREQRRLHYGYGRGAGAQTAKHLAAGDTRAVGVAVREAAHHVAMVPRALLAGRLRTASLQVPFLAGLARGFVEARRAGQRASRS
jgi:GT2 family glycosyltransferase